MAFDKRTKQEIIMGGGQPYVSKMNPHVDCPHKLMGNHSAFTCLLCSNLRKKDLDKLKLGLDIRWPKDYLGRIRDKGGPV